MSTPFISDNGQAKAHDTLQRLQRTVQQRWPGYVERSGQAQMMEGVLQTLLAARGDEQPLDGANIAVIEGKTGTGKTLGYLLPSVAVAQATGMTVVISTATIALQEQLYGRDLPQLVEILPEPVTYRLLKGRNRYVCAAKLEEPKAGRRRKEGDGRDSSAQSIDLSALRAALDSRRWNGERETLPDSWSDTDWAKVVADPHSCLRQHCSQFQQCPFMQARREAAAAMLVVANHDLVLSALSGETTIFDLNRTLFVFDEAHHLASTALEHFRTDYGLLQSLRWMSAADDLLSTLMSQVAGADDIAEKIGRAIDDLRENTEMLAGFLREKLVLRQKSRIRFPNGKLADGYAKLATVMRPLCQIVAEGFTQAIAVITELLAQANATEKAAFSELLQNLGQSADRFDRMQSLWAGWLEVTPIPKAKWVERVEGGGTEARQAHQRPLSARPDEYMLCISGITAAPVLTKALWRPARAVVLTSATLSACGNFDFFAKQIGVKRLPAVRYLSVESPFDYLLQGEIVVPTMRVTPKEASSHTRELGALLVEQIPHFRHGQLVLFASRQQMRDVYAELPEPQQRLVLLQGDMPRARLLQVHQERIAAGHPSIIFGLQSFGEGLDLPGNLCEHVAIAKIPFAPPDGAVEEALAEWLQSRGRDPFSEIAVPKAAQKLAQWVGRGIRTESDYARITIFDTRLTRKSYGRQILQGLPPLPVRHGMAPPDDRLSRLAA